VYTLAPNTMAKESDKNNNSGTELEYIPVDVSQLRVGTLVDRPLYARMESRNKFILMARSLHPLEQKTLDRFLRFGHVYSIFPALDERYGKLAMSVKRVEELLFDGSLAPFEKTSLIRKDTEWLSDLVMKKNGDADVAVFFLNKLLHVPHPQTIDYVVEHSVDLHEHSLRVASVATLLLLWTEAPKEEFLKDFLTSIYCEELSVYRDDSPNLRLIAMATAGYTAQDSDRAYSFELAKKGEIPGISNLDRRVVETLSRRGKMIQYGDELAEIVELARWICGGTGVQFRVLWESRLVRKLSRLMNFSLTDAPRKAAA